MKYKVKHKTIYNYGEIVNICHSLACLQPRNLPIQQCWDFKLNVSPHTNDLLQRIDYFGNNLHSFSIQQPHSKLEIVATSIVEVHKKPMDLTLAQSISFGEAQKLFKEDQDLRVETLEYLIESPMIQWNKDVIEFAKNCFESEIPLYKCVEELCSKIYKEFTFKPNFTNVNTSVFQVLKDKKGVCQDFTHFAIACFRSMGIAARYVSGYLETLPPPGKPKLQGSDASHAWVSVYIPGHGWFDYDPTNNIPPAERHVTISWGRDYSDVAPLKGIVFSSSLQSLKVEVDVLPVK